MDTFARDHLPPRRAWPDLLLLDGPERRERGGRAAARTRGRRSPAAGATPSCASARRRSRASLDDRAGERVLLHSPNTPEAIACWLGILLAGGIVVATMPLLRAREIAKVVAKAQRRRRRSSTRDAARARSAPRRRARCTRGRCRARGVVRARRHRRRRRRDHRVHLRARPATPKGCVHFHRDLLASCDTFARARARPAPDRRLQRHAAAGVHVRARRARCCSRCASAPSTAPVAARATCSTRSASTAITTLFTAPTAYRALLARGRPGRRCTRASRRASRCPPACRTRGTRRPASASSTGSARPRCCTSSSRSPARRGAARLVRAAGAGLRGADRRRRHGDAAAGRGGQAGRARADRLPLPRRPAPGDLRARRLEPHRRRVLDGRRRLLLVPGAHRRHDHLLGLQHLAASRSRRRCSSTRRSPSARSSAAPDEQRGHVVMAYVVASRAGRRRGELQDHVKARSRPTSTRAGSSSSTRCRARRRARSSATCCGSASMRRLQPPGWPEPRGYANGIEAERAARVRRRADRLGRDRRLRRPSARRARSARRCATSSRCWPRPAPARSTSPA